MTKYNTYTLENGLRIIHLPHPSPVIYCGYEIAAGTRDEQPGEEGLAHFCEHLTFKGTERRNALQIINAIEGVGGELNAFTNKEDTVFYAAISREHFGTAVDVLTDIVFHSQYPQQEIDKEVEVVCDEIESYNDSPAELIYDEFENLIFRNHPLGHNILGKAAQLRTYQTEDALRFVRSHYRPDNAVFFAYGDIDFGKLVNRMRNEIIRMRNDDYKTSTNPADDGDQHSPFLIPHSSLNETREFGSHQAHVMIGCQTFAYHDPRRITLFLLNNILGGLGMNARLNLSLRERYGLVYTVESSMVSYSDTGAWCIYFGCDHHDISKCCRLIRRELDRVMTKPLSPAQLSSAKRQLKGQLAIACDNREQFALDFGRSFLHHGNERQLDELFRRIDGVTAEEIQKTANELFAADHLTTLVFQ